MGAGWHRQTWEREASRVSSYSTDTGLRATCITLSCWMSDRLGPKSHPALRLICYFHFLFLVPFLVKIFQFPLNQVHTSQGPSVSKSCLCSVATLRASPQGTLGDFLWKPKGHPASLSKGERGRSSPPGPCVPRPSLCPHWTIRAIVFHPHSHCPDPGGGGQ